MKKPMKINARRNVTINRDEECTLEIRFVPTALYQGASTEDRREADVVLRTAANSLGMSHNGELVIRDLVVSQWWAVEVVLEGDWKYSGGDVATVGERYDSRVEVL